MNICKKFLSVLILSMSVFFITCRFFNSLEEIVDPDYNGKVTAVTFDKSSLNINTGESEYLKVTLKDSEQNKCDVSWEYDKEMIDVVTDKYGAIITGKKAGGTYIKASCNGIIATCLLSIISTGDDTSTDSYIFSSDSVIQLKPGNTQIVTVGLYGGQTADMEDFSWSIQDDSIANITYSRNNCVITAKRTGHTQITASHPKSKYVYTFVVYVYQDSFDVTFITTSYNVLSLDKNSFDSTGKYISVSLINPITPNYQYGFTWNYADEESKNIIQIDANNDSCVVIPKSNGVAKINVTHTNAEYPLSIIVRVTTIVQNTYINLSPSTLIVDGSDNWFSVLASIENYDNYASPDKFVWGFTDSTGRFVQDFPESVTNICDISTAGNKLQILGKKNGTFKVTVGHEIAEYKRNVLVILTNQIGSAKNASMYITTSDNYVITQNGAEPKTVSVSLNGGEPGDENDFEWYIDGDNIIWEDDNSYLNNIAEITYVNGKIIHGSPAARSAFSSEITTGKLTIDPKYTSTPGTFKITIRHPKCLYDCNITVKVYSKYALLADPINIGLDGNSPLKIVNGHNVTCTATLSNATSGGENKITWESSNEAKVNVSPKEGSTSVITACGTGQGQTYITLNYQTENEKAYTPLKRLVLTADNDSDFENMKYISSTKQYIRLLEGSSNTEIEVDCGGNFSVSDKISWVTDNNTVITPNNSTSTIESGKSKITLTGLKAGTATITASILGDANSEKVTFSITVVPKDEKVDIISAPKYLTTSKNAIVFENVGPTEMEYLGVTGVNISSFNMQSTVWAIEDKETEEGELSHNNNFTLTPNGENASIYPNKKGKSVIKVTNPNAANDITINAKCGNILEWDDGYVCYITTDNDVVNISKDNKTYTIGAALENVTSTNNQWNWKITQGSNIVEILNYTNAPNITSSCTLKVLEAGQAIVTIYNDEAVAEKEILVNVANSQDELSSMLYLTTTTNVVVLGEGTSKTVSVSVANAKNNVVTGYSWDVIAGADIIDVVGSGATALVTGKKCGTAKIRIMNPSNCTYPLEMIVNVVDPLAVKDDPYISCQNIVTVSVGGSNATVLADLIGGSDADKANFTWIIDNSSVAKLYSSNNTAEIKGLKEGVTQVTVSHPKSSYSRTILIIVEAKIVSSCYIQLSQGIVKATPGGDDIVIDATLTNGTAEDNARFKWWASDYEKINIEYTGPHCVIKPLFSGSVTIYCSHPKAADDAASIIRISNYDKFAFEVPKIELDSNTVTYINLETPAEYVDSGCWVEYKSNNPKCTAKMPSAYATKVCLIETQSCQSESSATITATLKDKAGQIKATAELLVLINPTDANKAYMSIDNTKQTITLQKGTIDSFTVRTNNTDNQNFSFLVGNKSDINDYTSSFRYENEMLEVIRNRTEQNVFQIKAKASGATTISIKNPDCDYPLTVYIYVPGTDDPSITLNYSELPIFLGGDAEPISATIKNSKAVPEWKITTEDGEPLDNRELFDLVCKGNKAMVTPIKLGSAYITATITEEGMEYSASCLIKVREVAHLNLYIYLHEELQDEKIPVNKMFVYPGETKILHYDAVDSDGQFENLRVLQTSANKYISVEDCGNKGFIYDGISYPEGVGTILLKGLKEGKDLTNIKITTMSNVNGSVDVQSSYMNRFTIDNTQLTYFIEPKDTKTGLLDKYVINYTLRPALSVIRIYVPEDMHNYVYPYGIGEPIENDDETYSNYKTYEFTPSTRDDVEYDVNEGIISGQIKFFVKGEFFPSKLFGESTTKNGIWIEAENRNIQKTSSDLTEKMLVGKHHVNMSYTYKDYDIKITHLGNYPKSIYSDNDSVLRTGENSGYSKFAYDIITIGDGEFAKFKIEIVDRPLTNATISATYNKFNDVTNYNQNIDQYGLSEPINEGLGVSYCYVGLGHSYDYGAINRNLKDSYFYNINSNDKITEAINTTLRSNSNMNNLIVEINNGKTIKKLIPVKLEIRNSPCMIINSVYNTINSVTYTEEEWEELLKTGKNPKTE